MRIFRASRLIPPISEATLPYALPFDREFISRSSSHIVVVRSSDDDEEEEEHQEENPVPATSTSAAAASEPTLTPSADPFGLLMRRFDDVALTQAQAAETAFQMAAAQRHEHKLLSGFFGYMGYIEPA